MIKEELLGGIQGLINLIENSQEIDIARNTERSQVFEEIRDNLIKTHNLFLKFDGECERVNKSKVFAVRIALTDSIETVGKKLERLSQKIYNYKIRDDPLDDRI